MAATRNTPQKEIIFAALQDMRDHPTASMVYEKIHLAHPSISRSTVFRVLSRLAEEGSVLKFRVMDSDDRFDFRNDMHYHIECQRCGAVADVSMPLEDMMEKVEHASGYQIDRYMVEFAGLCPVCQEKQMLAEKQMSAEKQM